MTPERWRQIENLYLAARGSKGNERAIMEGCTDPEIRARVERMLSLDSAGTILDQPAPDLLEVSRETIAIEGPGAELGPYKIETAIGAGGMGVVYRAVDTRLGRVVAIKVIDERYSERFHQEAQAISSLNHPHICTLYDVGPNFLVMELLEGQSLKARIAASPVRADEFLSIAISVSDALDAAHSRGIVHRDVKPGNIFITSRGDVKILDFGLAKKAGPAQSGHSFQEVLTTSSATLGTASYMSPEQARGMDVDPRTDLFSFGVVLYEMATGLPPFTGSNWIDIRHGILNSTPPSISELNPSLPLGIVRIIERALEKDRTLRYQTACELRADLVEVQRRRQTPSMAHRMLPLAMAAVTAVMLLVAFGVRRFYSRSIPVTNPAEYIQLTNFTDGAQSPALSPDGRMVTFIRGGRSFLSGGQVYVKALPDGPSTRLSDDPLPKYGPVFSPDGTRITYTRTNPPGSAHLWDTWSVPVSGGRPSRFLPNASGLSWIDSRHVLFSEVKSGVHMGIVTSNVDGTDSREIYLPAHERGMAHFSYLSPDRQSVLVVEMDRTASFRQCRLLPFDGHTIGRPVGPPGVCTSAGWSSDGKWMYFGVSIGGHAHLWRQRYPDGPPEQITFGAGEEKGVAVASDGRSLVTSVGLSESAIWIHDGRADRAITSEGYSYDPRFSPDGKRVFYLWKENSASPASELYCLDLGSGATDRPLPGVPVSSYQISRDGKEIAFTRRRGDGGDPEVWLSDPDRRAPARRVARAGDKVFFGPDGDLIFRSLGQQANYLVRISHDGTKRNRILDTPITDLHAVSPDGEWVVFSQPPDGQNASPRVIAMPVRGGAPQVICVLLCTVQWSYDGRYLYVTHEMEEAAAGKTLAFPIPPGQPLPHLPAAGLGSEDSPGAQEIERSRISPGANPTIYLFTENRERRNLFRIPLH